MPRAWARACAPLSETIPKPLVPLAGKPLIAYALESLERAGVDEIVINTHHLAAQIELFLADYAARPGAPRIRISHEEERLETGGGVRQALGWLGDDAFYVLNSDAVIADHGAPALEPSCRGVGRRSDGCGPPPLPPGARAGVRGCG